MSNEARQPNQTHWSVEGNDTQEKKKKKTHWQVETKIGLGGEKKKIETEIVPGCQLAETQPVTSNGERRVNISNAG